MAPRYNQVTEISPQKENWSMLVRVVKLWFVKDINKDKLPFSLEMVLMDSKGDCIHASIRRNLIYKFEKCLKEDAVYTMSNFSVAANLGSYRTTKHGFKLNFQFSSKVNKVGGGSVPSNIYCINNPSDIFQASYDTDFLVDIMGMLTGVGAEKTYDKNGEKIKMNIIELDHDGFRFKCTLFGPYVEALNAFLASGETDNVVVVILFAKVKNFQGKATIQNTIYSTKIMFNPDLLSALDLKKRMTSITNTPSPGINLIQDASKISLDDDFLNLTPSNTIEGLKETDKEMSFVVLGTVNHIVDDCDWWYTACLCNKKVVPDEKMYFCAKCNKHVINVTPRYMIKLKVIDSTASATFVLFDRDAAMLFQKPCAEMIETHGLGNANESIPKEISDMIGQTYLFKVDSNVSNGGRYELSFRIKKMSADNSIIQKFNAKNNLAEDVAEDGSIDVEFELKKEIEIPSTAQDLMSKFSEPDNAIPIKIAGPIIDITGDDEVRTSGKRPCPFEEGDNVDTTSTITLKRHIKIEKD